MREKFSLTGDQLISALESATERTDECVILSTCNRLEVYALLPHAGDTEHQPIDGHAPPTELQDPSAWQGARIQDLLRFLFGPGFSEIEPYTYLHTGASAVKHLLTVASGIDSLILGEVQILGQVRRAWQTAHKAGAAGPVLSKLFHKAVTLGKRVQSETPISRRPASVSYAAVVLARQSLHPSLASAEPSVKSPSPSQAQGFGLLNDRRVLVIGTGEIGEGVARCLHDYGLRATVVAHRQLEKARQVAHRYDADVATWDELPDRLALADIVISSTAAPHTVLQRHQIADALAARPDRPLCLIDLAVPRDIDPLAADLPGVHLYNIDDLQAVVSTTLQERQSALPEIRSMIDDETSRYVEWLRMRSAAPTIRTLLAQAAAVTDEELAWAMPKLSTLSPREKQVIEIMASRIAGKLMHTPIQWLKAQAVESGEIDYDMDDINANEVPGLFYSEEEGT